MGLSRKNECLIVKIKGLEQTQQALKVGKVKEQIRQHKLYLVLTLGFVCILKH